MSDKEDSKSDSKKSKRSEKNDSKRSKAYTLRGKSGSKTRIKDPEPANGLSCTNQ